MKFLKKLTGLSLCNFGLHEYVEFDDYNVLKKITRIYEK